MPSRGLDNDDEIGPELQRELDEAYLRDNKKPLKASVLDRLQPASFKVTSKEKEEKSTCLVCYDDFEGGDKVLYLPCMDFFHHKCIVRWFEESSQCPKCR
jgi:hypothetical protein